MHLTKINNPFMRHIRNITEVEADYTTLDQMCTDFFNEIKRYRKNDDIADSVIATVNGSVIEFDKWKSTCLNNTDYVMVMPKIAKGQNEKMVLNIIFFIALIWVAPGVAFAMPGGAAAGATAFTGMASLSTLGLAYTAAFVTVGGILINSMGAKPKDRSNDFNASELSQTFGFEPSTMQRQGLAVPRYYGRNKLFGNVIATHTELTTPTSNIQRLKTLFGLCLGPIRGVREVPDQQWLTKGTIALFGYCAANVYIDDVLVESLNGETLLDDDFDDGDVNDWTLVNDCEVGSPTFTNSSLTGKLTANFPTGSQPKSSDADEKGAFAYSNAGFNWTDYTLTCKIKIVDSQRACHGIMFRYVDQDNYYRFSIDGRNDRVRLVRVKNSETSILYSESYTDDNYNDWMDLEITCNGPEITINYGENVLIQFVDNDATININNQPASNFPGLMFRDTKGLVNQEHIEWFDKVYHEIVPNYRVSSNKPKIYRTLFNDFDSINIDMSFPMGLYDCPTGTFNNYTVGLKIEIKKSSEKDNDYLTITKSDESITDNTASKVIRTYKYLRRKITSITKANPGVVTVDDITNLSNGDTIMFTDVVGMPELENEEHIIANINTTNKTFEIGDTSTYTAAATAGVCNKDLVDVIERGNYYDIKVTKTTIDKYQSRYGDRLFLDRVRLIYNHPFKYPRLATVGINVVATDSLSGSIGFSAIADCLYVRVYDSDLEEWGVMYTTNPAWILFDILTQPVYSGTNPYKPGEEVEDPLTVERYECKDPSELNLNKFIEFAEFCNQEVENTNTINIENISNDVQAIITTVTEHDFVAGDEINILGVDDSGMVEFENGKYEVAEVITKFSFSINYDTSEFSSYYKTGTILHFEGTDEATTAEDSGPNNLSVTLVGTLFGIAKIDSAQKKWGNTSLYLNGCNLSYAYVSSEAKCKVLDSLSGSWTFEAWVKRDDLTGTDYIMVFVGNVSGINGTTDGVTTTDWTHVAWILVGNGTIVKEGKYVNGIQIAYEEFDVDDLNTLWGSSFRVGQTSSTFEGWIDEVRTIADNPYNANPNVGLTDTITIPTGPFSVEDEIYGTVTKIKHFIEFNGGFDDVVSVWEAALRIGEMSRCIPMPEGNKITLIIDKPRSPVAMFTVGNIGVDSFEEVFVPQQDMASEIEVNYRDEMGDYERTPILIIDPDAGVANKKITLDLFGITDSTYAENIGKFKLLCNKLQHRIVTIDVDIDALGVTVGDNILIQHDVPDWGNMSVEGFNQGGGRVSSATNNTNAVVIIDAKLSIPAFSSTIGITNVSNAVQASITTEIAHGLEVGDQVVINGVNTYMVEFEDGTYNVVGVTSDTELTINYNTSEFSTYGDNSIIKLLIHGNGEDGSTDITDSSSQEHAIIPTGAEIDTEFKKFGTGSIKCNLGHLSISDSTDWDLFKNKEESWTLEFFIKKETSSVVNNTESQIYQYYDEDNWWIFIYNEYEGSGMINLMLPSGTIISCIKVITDTDLHHIALVKVGGSSVAKYAVYFDGTQLGYSESGNEIDVASELIVYINGGGFNIWIDELRISKFNIFNASPNVGNTDTIEVPISEYNTEVDVPYGTIKKYIESEDVYEIMVRMNDDTIETKTITDYNDKTGKVTVDGVFDKCPSKNDLWAIGKQNLVCKEFTVIGIEKTSDQKVTIIAVEYDPDVYVNDPVVE